MAAYAALVSLEHIMNNLHLHSRPPITILTKMDKLLSSPESLLPSEPIFLHKEQVDLLTQKITFLQEFLQLYNPNLDYSKEADPLETRIARAAYAAEDAIESHIYFQLTGKGDVMSSNGLYEALEKVIQDMTLIEKEAKEIKETVTESTPPADSSGSSSSSSLVPQKRSSMMVGADGLLLEMKNMLVSNARELQTLPIVGMGGSGKTTLALNIYHDSLIKEHFHACAWVTISQEYSIKEILRQLLTQLIKKPDQHLSEGELGEMLHKHLYSIKYMIILDDMWSIKAWDGIRRFLPNNGNHSRIVITTRLTTLASSLSNSNSLGMNLLDEDASWDLLSQTVFGGKGCPSRFEEIGRKIGKSCKGLPLSIVVVGGLLAKSELTIKSWKHMEDNLNAIVNLDDDERCLKTLYMSYKQLPVHLKPCFLYMGIYREDHEIRIPNLIRLWVAEGFLKPASGKRPEDVARGYIKDLSDRNLILIHKMGSIGSIKECKIHDLLRDLCLREARKEGFYTIYPGHKIGNEMSRIVVSGSTREIEEINALSSAPQARSLIPFYSFFSETINSIFKSRVTGDSNSGPSVPNLNPPYTRSLILDVNAEHGVPPQVFRLVRILCPDFKSDKLLDNIYQLVNSRFFAFTYLYSELPSSFWLLWNIHSLTIDPRTVVEIIPPTDIWYMSHIRHLYCYGLILPYPTNVPDNIVLESLQTLGKVMNFTWSEQVVKRIPNIKKMYISYYEEVDDRFCLTNLECLEKLESLDFNFYKLKCPISYPQSLKKLTLNVSKSQSWKGIPEKIGELPLLEKLKLYNGNFEGEWETSEGQFRSLKYLSLSYCVGLQVWTSEASHFPALEHLRLVEIKNLEEIPIDFADISTLGLIELLECSDSVVESARRILEEQEELYGEDETTLQVQVRLAWAYNRAPMRASKSPNFHVTVPR